MENSSHITPYILATSGHVDHGKSALVRALTGIDPDRLPEEKARGITIDLGFAHLMLSASPTEHYQIGIIDVPGHEDFIKNMVAGIGSIDIALLVIAADDGWMPQTEEHSQILGYLGVQRGVIALTKIDLLDANDPNALRAAIEKVRQRLADSSLQSAPIIPTSTLTGAGIEELKAALAQTLAATPPQEDTAKPRLAVDRVFSLKGIGTVVTGTLAGGTLYRGQEVVVQPSGQVTRIRTLQSYGRDVQAASPGSRVALGLPDLHPADSAAGHEEKSVVARGDIITLPNLGQPSATLDVLLHRDARSPVAALKDGARMHVHLGSADVAGKVLLLDGRELAVGESCLAQIRLEKDAFVLIGDRLLLRDWSARNTIAGGLVLDAVAMRRGFRSPVRSAQLQKIAQDSDHPVIFIERIIQTSIERHGFALRERLLRQSRFGQPEIDASIAKLLSSGEIIIIIGHWLIAAARWQSAMSCAAEAVDAAHKTRPQEKGLPLAELRAVIGNDLPTSDLFDALVTELCARGFARTSAAIARANHRPALPAHLQAAGNRILATLAKSGLEPPSRRQIAPDKAAEAALRFLLQSGLLVALGEEIVLLADDFSRCRQAIVDSLRAEGPATVAELKQVLGATRRVAVPLLEKLDRDGVTLRRGDQRILK